MSRRTLRDVAALGWRDRFLIALPAVVFAVGAIVLPGARPELAAARGVDGPMPVHRPLHNMVEGYAEGTVVALEYLQTFYCPTTPSSDLDPPFGHGDGHPESEDPKEYQVPPCFFGDTGTGSVLPARLQAGAFPGVKTFYGLPPWFGRPGGSPRALA